MQQHFFKETVINRGWDGSGSLARFKQICLFVVAVALAALGGCPQPTGQSGIGYFQILPDSAARTIMPDLMQSQFALYTLEFAALGKNTQVVDRANSDLGRVVSLEVGSWDVTVTAYLDLYKAKPAARGIFSGIEIKSGVTVTMPLNLVLKPIAAIGTGTFAWDIAFPNDVDLEWVSIEIATYDEYINNYTTQVPAIDYYPAPGDVRFADRIDLPVGYYIVNIILYNNELHILHRTEVLHIYQNLVSAYAETFSAEHFKLHSVTNNKNDGVGSLRYAIEKASDGDAIFVEAGVGTIKLDASLYIDKNLIIDGNGATVTKSDTMMYANNSQLMLFSSDATIKRLHFKDGLASDYGGAIQKNSGDLTLESCIFSGNRNNGSTGGGAIYNSGGNLLVMACTFYGNSSGNNGGAIHQNSSGDTVLIGNLFYENSIDAGYYPVVARSSGTVVSHGYNAVDASIGNTYYQAGWAVPTMGTDYQLSDLPIAPKSFKLLSGRTHGNIPGTSDLATGGAGGTYSYYGMYPVKDFYGSSIDLSSGSTVSGAVQDMAIGYYLDLAVNDPSRGSPSVITQPNDDGCYEANTMVLIKADADDPNVYDFSHWERNGAFYKWSKTTSVAMTSHIDMEAVFSTVWVVSNFFDSTPGSLRDTLTSAAQDWDIIRLNAATAPSSQIALDGGSINVISINKNISIEGNGITLTPGAGWSSSATTQLLFINSGKTVKIHGIHFKDGRATDNGGAILNSGNLTLESCIFNENTIIGSSARGGAICNEGTLAVLGCTFYHNLSIGSSSQGGAIYNSGTLTITGNLFYSNDATTGDVVYAASGTVNSAGFNVVDIPAIDAGFVFNNDIYYTNTNLPFISTTTFVPDTYYLTQRLPLPVPLDFPPTDFYGSVRTAGVPGAVDRAP